MVVDKVFTGALWFFLTWTMTTVVYCSFIWMLWFRDFSISLAILGTIIAVLNYQDMIKHFIAWRYSLWKANIR